MKKQLVCLLALFFSMAAFAQNPTAKQVLEKYVTAIGGKKKLETVKDLTYTLKGNMQGADLTQEIKRKAPDKFKTSMTAAGMGEMMTMVMDGKKLSMNMMGNSKTVSEGPELDVLKSQNSLFPELSYEKLKTNVTVAGKDTVNGSLAYKLEITVGTTKMTEYFDIASGFKVRQVAPDGQGGTANVDFSNYKEVSGIKFPYTYTIGTPMGSLVMEVQSIEVNKGIADEVFMVK